MQFLKNQTFDHIGTCNLRISILETCIFNMGCGRRLFRRRRVRFALRRQLIRLWFGGRSWSRLDQGCISLLSELLRKTFTGLHRSARVA
ncbi:MAG: hypothetical protein BVN32_09745 [Proteobacteria bacterium ST_bin14]|nr:MAG: hypothetical protein BVN32_09745 [Proteobacteria bacterium ST_bin14]